MLALIHSGRINQIVTDGRDFPVHPDFQWVPCGAEITTRHTWDGQKFMPPEPAPVDLVAEAQSALDMLDWKSIRAMRSILAAMASGQEPESDDVAVLNGIESQAKTEREKIKK